MSQTRELVGSSQALAELVRSRTIRSPARIKQAVDAVVEATGHTPYIVVAAAKEYLKGQSGSVRQVQLLGEALELFTANAGPGADEG